MSIIIMILLLSFLILIHEVGHFLSAKLLGMKVSKFGFGLPIGPTLWKKQVGDVEVLVHACLLGGYVSFPDDEKEVDLPKDSPERFTNKPVWQRMIVISAGVIANVIAAIFLVLMAATIWGKLPSGEYNIFVGGIHKKYPAIESNLKVKDKLLTINGSKVASPFALTLYAQNSARYDGKISKDDLDMSLNLLKSLNPQLDDTGVISAKTIVKLPEKRAERSLILEDKVLKGYKLYKSDKLVLSKEQVSLRDKLLKENTYVADGKTTLKDIAYAISDSKCPIDMVVLRDGKEVKIDTIYPNKKGLVGVVPNSKEVLIQTKNPKTIVTASVHYLWDQTYMLVYGLYQLFTGKIPMKNLHGIVVITKLGGDVIQNSGLFYGILLTAMISIDLALVNFLPIPALDGGHFMFLIIEKLRGKPLNEDTLNKISSVFFGLLLLFMFFVIFNDIYALVKHQF